jgi:hypothetical protein
MKSILVSLLFLFVSISANGAIKTWDGGGSDGNLATAANWVGDVSPASGDDLVFPVAANTINNNYSSATVFRSLTFQGGNYSLNGNALRLTNNININGGGHNINAEIILSGTSQTFTSFFNSAVNYKSISVGINSLTVTGDGLKAIETVSGSGTLTCEGESQTSITGIAGFSGNYVVNSGILEINADAVNGNVIMNGGTLTGLGIIANITSNSGVITPSPDFLANPVLTAKNVFSTSLTTFKFGIFKNLIPGIFVSSRLDVNGTVTINNSTLQMKGFTPKPPPNVPFNIINNDGTDAVVGTFNNLPEGSRFYQDGSLYKISYVGGTGNDVTITGLNIAPFDFEGRGKSNLAVFRPSLGAWLIRVFSLNATFVQDFGAGTDLVTPADFDGDFKVDLAIFRPSSGIWVVLRSSDNTLSFTPFGITGDLPVPNDFDGDKKADFAVFRPSTGVWYELRSIDNSVYIRQFGANGDKPLMADFDGDGRGDISVFRPSANVWYYLSSLNNNFSAVLYGIANDIPVPADYDGDGKTDYAVFRASNVNGEPDFFILQSSTGTTRYIEYGRIGDIPQIGDLDGDGKIDVTVFRPSNNTWYSLQSTNGFFATVLGESGDKPVNSAYIY